MKWVLWFLVTAAGLVALIGVVGMLLPTRHRAAVRITLNQPIERVFELVSDVPGGTEWRSDLKHVEILSAEGSPLRWRETTGFGAVVMVMEASDPPTRLVGRIDDPDQPFGGRWIYDLESTANATVLTITEEGEVYNPFFRFISRFMFGHYRTLEAYVRDLTRHLGESSEPVRVKSEG